MFYRELKAEGWSVRVGMEATRHARWFERLLAELGKRLLVEIEASHVAKYQRARLAEGAANRTVNIEVSMLRQIMRKFGAWARIQSNVSMLPEREDVGRALTSEEESALLLECGEIPVPDPAAICVASARNRCALQHDSLAAVEQHRLCESLPEIG